MLTFVDNKHVYSFSANKEELYITPSFVPFIRDTGCYIVMVNAKNHGPNGIFCCARSDKTSSGLVTALALSDTQLKLEWNPYEYPKICVQNKMEFDVVVICT